jgi:methyl-accepting chemotaxis protein
MGLMVEAKGSPAAALQKDRIEASILSFDGKDFVRTKAANTKLEYSSPAYGALVKKHSYVGDATVFGKKYDADYAPLTSDDGKLIGALFVGVAK